MELGSAFVGKSGIVAKAQCFSRPVAQSTDQYGLCLTGRHDKQDPTSMGRILRKECTEIVVIRLYRTSPPFRGRQRHSMIL